jgi:hypothetical protein
MPVYYFNVRDGNNLTRDPAGAELENVDAARRSGLAAAKIYLAADALRDKVANKVFEISDGRGVVVATVPFSEAKTQPNQRGSTERLR